MCDSVAEILVFNEAEQNFNSKSDPLPALSQLKQVLYCYIIYKPLDWLNIASPVILPAILI